MASHRAVRRQERRRRATMTTAICVLVLTLVLTAPRLVEATCAWVLWTHTMLASTQQVLWSPMGAEDTKEGCQRQLVLTAEGLKRSGWGGTVTSDSAVLGTKDGSQSQILQCLPDTIDPRGVKGGGR